MKGNRAGDSPGRKGKREQHEAELDGENCDKRHKKQHVN